MAHTFSYSVLTAVPDPRRGERVNIGIAVFLPERVDVRISELGKIHAITGTEWSGYMSEVAGRLINSYRAGEPAPQFVERMSMLEPVVKLSEAGWLSISQADQYEERITQILESLVKRPRFQNKSKSTRINTEIARVFRRAKVLASPDEGIAVGKVVRDIIVSADDDLRADFGLKNGLYYVTVTVDLRRPNADKGQAAIKAITLDRAERVFDGVRKIGVYAAPRGASEFRPHIHLLSEYANFTYDWTDPEQRDAYVRSIYDAVSVAGQFSLKPQ